ncbi:hypothetical protein ACFPRL_22705 [Pseudoclavibacter helvolus]
MPLARRWRCRAWPAPGRLLPQRRRRPAGTPLPGRRPRLLHVRGSSARPAPGGASRRLRSRWR